tara:strand:- start:475 stop:5088 length:4614 start_codon:yes stop_codon:yes gene_type:complete
MVGSLLFAFTDSQWFNAVESEVYAMSMLSTALVVWLTLKWTENRGADGNTKYILLTAYVFGLSIGVHPLNLLALPFVIFAIYFSHTKDDFGGFILDNAITYTLGTIVCAIFSIFGLPLFLSIIISILFISLYLSTKFLVLTKNSPNLLTNNFIFLFLKRVSIPIISLLIFAIAYKGILMGFTGLLDQVTDFQNFLKFYDSSSNEIEGIERIIKISELIILPILTIILIPIGIFLSYKSIVKSNVLKIISLSVILFYIGYSTYASVVIRAHKNPSINMNSPSNPERFKEYIFREQYGDLAPIDIWGILKYYLGGDKSSESELANFRTRQYYKESENSSEKIILSIEGKSSKLSSMPDIGESRIGFILDVINNPTKYDPIIVNRINTFKESTNLNPIVKPCGTLMGLSLKDPIDNYSALDNITFISNNFEIEQLNYHLGSDVRNGCDLDEGHVYLSSNGNILYNSNLDTIIGFDFDLKNITVEKIGTQRIDYSNLLNSPNNIRWIPHYQYGIPKHELSNILSNKDIMDFIIDYQLNEMYLRYFGWQFIGREYDGDEFSYSLATKNTSIQEEDLKTFGINGVRNAQMKEMNNSITKNKSNVNWTRYGIPFALIFGIIGMIYHFIRDPKNAFSVFILFIVTGVLILIYINQIDPQPRERDYAYVGSFFAFSIWIGIGCMSLFESGLKLLQYFNLNTRKHILMLIIPLSCFLMGVMPVNYLINDFKVHNRSGNFAARDFGYNNLISCKPNSVLITVGDNDTYPLWFNQGTEKINNRTRVVNLSLMNAPWYIEQIYNNNDPGNINFNFDEPFLIESDYQKLSTSADSLGYKMPGRADTYDLGEEFIDSNENGKWDEGEFYVDSDNIYIKSDVKNGWYIDINKNQKYDQYESEKIIRSLKDDPLSDNMNAFAITIHAIKRWDPYAWIEVEKNYFKLELKNSLFGKETPTFKDFIDFKDFINLKNDFIKSSKERIGAKKITGINGLEDVLNDFTYNEVINENWVNPSIMRIVLEDYENQVVNDIFKLFENSYSNHIEEYIASGNGYYKEWYKTPKNLKTVWGKNLDQKGSTYIFPVADFLPKRGFSPLINYKNEMIGFPVSSLKTNGQLTLQEFMVLKILEDIEHLRSVYFTSSVPSSNHVGLRDFLEYQGLVSEVLKPSERISDNEMYGRYYLNSGTKYINKEIFEENIHEHYKFENLNNPGVYYSHNNLKHMQEYWHIFLAYLNEFRYGKTNDYSPKDCRDEIASKLGLITSKVSPDVIKIQEFSEEPIKNVYLLNLYYAAGLYDEYKKMLDELINDARTTIKGLIYVLESIPSDDKLIDYKLKKITEIINMVGEEDSLSEIYRIALYKSQIKFEDISEAPLLEKYWEDDIIENYPSIDKRQLDEFRNQHYMIRSYGYSEETNYSYLYENYATQIIKSNFYEFTDSPSDYNPYASNILFDKNCNGFEDVINIDISNHIAIQIAKKIKSKERILSEFKQFGFNNTETLKEFEKSNQISDLNLLINNILSNYLSIELLLYNSGLLKPIESLEDINDIIKEIEQIY